MFRDTDVVVIGAGIGGLCAAALLAHYGYRVLVLESHSVPGGAAHGFEHEGFHFDSGPSFFSGLSIERSFNPVKQVLDLVGEKVPCVRYDGWNVHTPEGVFRCVSDAAGYRAEIVRFAGEAAAHEWDALLADMAPLSAAVERLPTMALRGDVGAALTTAPFLPGVLQLGTRARDLPRPFSEIVARHVRHPFVRNMLDLECFMLSGLPASGTVTAEMAFMFHLRQVAPVDFPLGGTQALVDALVRGIEAHGGQVLCGAHVERVLVARGRATGVMVRRKGEVRARRAVISNASVWDTLQLVPEGLPDALRRERAALPPCDSFVHLHLGLDGGGLEGLDCHAIVLDDWNLTRPQNVCAISIPSVLDGSLAPQGKLSVHAYTPATEPYAEWEGLRRGSEAYLAKKRERTEVLWRALERVIPDVRARAEVTLVGTPLTHERFLRRHRGSYGPALRAGVHRWPGATTPLEGLYCCGDSTNPGIGVPAAAASGIMAANTIAPLHRHARLLAERWLAERDVQRTPVLAR